MKKTLSIILTLTVMLAVLPFGLFSIPVAAATSGTTGDCTWSLENSILTISGNGAMGNYNYNPWEGYGSPDDRPAPWGLNATKVIIEEGVTNVGYYAFAHLSKLESITIPASVTTIPNSAFYGCSSLANISVASNNTVYHSQNNCLIKTATNELIWGTKASTIPNYVTSIGDFAFGCCDDLTNIVIPNGVTSIGDYAFSYCDNLKTLNLPKSLTNIDYYAFWDSYYFEIVYYRGTEEDLENSNISANFQYAEWYCNSCVNKIEHSYDNTCDEKCNDCDGTRTASHRYDSVCDTICNLCDHIREVPHSYNNLCDTTCNLCGFVREVAEHVYDNDGDADCNVCGLIRGEHDHIYDNACDIDCNACGLSREVPDHIYNNVCDTTCNICNKSRIAPHNFDNENDTICNDCGCKTGISGGCTWTLKDNVLTISGNGMMEDYGNASSTPQWSGSLSEVIIEEGVTGIGSYAFSNNSINKLFIPKSLTYIGNEAFNPANLLNYIYYNGSPEDREKINIVGEEDYIDFSIGIATWYYNTGRTSGITGDCTWKLNDTILTISGNGKMGNYSSDYFGSYFSTAPWGNSITKVIIEDSVTSIGSYAFAYCNNLLNITLPSSLKTIGKNAFEECIGLMKITMPDSVTSIDSYAFYNCNNLTNTPIPDSLISIGNYAFGNCYSISKVVIGNSVTNIGDYAFDGCSNLKNVTFSNSLQTVGANAFDDCNKINEIRIFDLSSWLKINFANQESSPLRNNANFYINDVLTKDIVIPNDITKIKDYAFINGATFESVTMHNNVTSIGNSAFGNCSGLTNIIMPESVESFYGAFKGCTSLTSVYIPHKITSIGESTFDGCRNLTSIFLPKNVTAINLYAFRGCNKLNEIWYTGSTTDRDLINIYPQNDCITNALWHYNTCEYNIHTFDNDCDTNCNNCDLVRVVPDHIYDDNCDTDCNVCNKVRDITHTYDNDCDTTCNICQFVREVPDHIYDNACDTTCNVCQLIREVPDHVYDNDCDTNCNVCQFVREVPDHVYDNACDTTCNVCQLVREVPDHIYDNDCDTNCNVCQLVREVPDHIYDNDCDTTCNVCQLIREVPDHVYDNDCDTNCNVCQLVREVPDHIYDNACDTNCNVCQFIREVPDHVLTLNSNHTCEICKYSKTPNKPILESKTNNSVTLVKSEGFEYSINGSDWQLSNVFTNLSPSTTYTFYQRVQESALALASDVSEGMSVTFKAWQQTPPAIIVASFTDTTITLIPLSGCEYSIDGISWNLNNIFTGLSPATKYVLYQRYFETQTHEASNISIGVTVTTDKSKQTRIPDAPTLQNFTANSITLTLVDGCEYSKDGGVTWQTSNIFDDLECGTEYTFYQRYKETDITYVGKSSPSLTAKTDKGTQFAPSAPTLKTQTYNSVTLVKTEGCEYSINGSTWQTSNVFTGLKNATDYIFYQRKAETDRYYASSISASLSVRTDNVPKALESTSDFTVTTNTVSKITTSTTAKELLDGLAGGEFCKVYKDGQEISGDAVIGTGTVVKILDGDTVKAEYTVIITGDINGDGGITITDMLAVKAHILGKSTLSGVYETAADTSGDSMVSITDFIQVKASILGKGEIVAR